MSKLPPLTHKLRVKPVFRYSPAEKKVRLGRIMWATGPDSTQPGWYSAFISLTLVPRIFRFERGFHAWELTILGVRIHHQKSYGGWCV